MIALLLSCWGDTIEPVDGKLPCQDTAVAISRRTLECTGDTELAADRYDLFFEEYRCLEVDFTTELHEAWYDNLEEAPGDWFHCSWAVGELACELTETYGDDLEQWLDASPVCGAIMEGKQ